MKVNKLLENMSYKPTSKESLKQFDYFVALFRMEVCLKCTIINKSKRKGEKGIIDGRCYCRELNTVCSNKLFEWRKEQIILNKYKETRL